MKRKDVVEMMKRQFEEKKKIPKLKLSHELIKNNLMVTFEVDNEFKIGKYFIEGNFATFDEGAITLAAKKIERMREIIQRFHRDEITIEDFNALLNTLLKTEQKEQETNG